MHEKAFTMQAVSHDGVHGYVVQVQNVETAYDFLPKNPTYKSAKHLCMAA